jgi:hypothetical protein
MVRRTLVTTYLATYLLAVAPIVRYLVRFHDDRFWSIALLLGGYLVQLFAEPFVLRGSRLLAYLHESADGLCS